MRNTIQQSFVIIFPFESYWLGVIHDYFVSWKLKYYEKINDIQICIIFIWFHQKIILLFIRLRIPFPLCLIHRYSHSDLRTCLIGSTMERSQTFWHHPIQVIAILWLYSFSHTFRSPISILLSRMLLAKVL